MKGTPATAFGIRGVYNWSARQTSNFVFPVFSESRIIFFSEITMNNTKIDIVDTAIAAGHFETLAAALKAADLVQT